MNESSTLFCHDSYLLSGMRGAADSNRDGRVTLNEAYQFAYNETLQRTETSRAGAQHPAYDIQLAGTGDLVMTDLHTSTSRLVLSRELFGRIYVRDASGHLLVELRKEPSYPVELGLEPGPYQVVMDSDGRIFEAKADLAEGGRGELGKDQFSAVAPMLSTRRGDEVAPDVARVAQPPIEPDLPASDGHKDVPFDMVLVPGVRMSGPSDLPIRSRFVLGLVGYSDSLHGVQLSLAANISDGELRGLQAAMLNLNRGSLRGIEAGLVNLNVGDIHGIQAGLINVVKSDVHGTQAGLINVVKSDVHGTQAGLVNVIGPAAESSGAQVGLANVNQSVGMYNGAMVGLVNMGRKVHGAQVGLVNIASEVEGAQVGLVNFARKNRGASIGLLPIVLDGYHHGLLWFSDASALNLGAKLGTRHVYVILGAGMTRDRTNDERREFSATFGIGGHITPVRRPFFLDVDVTSTIFSDGDGNGEHRQISSLRLQAGWQFAPYFAVVAGPTLNVQVAPDREDRAPRGVGSAEQVWHHGDHTVRMYPGLVAGLQF